MPPSLGRTVAATALLAAACGGSADGASGCGPAVREALDPQSGIHLLDGDDISYLTDPPTSGPHVSTLPPAGAQTGPVPRPVQVAVLEGGGVMVQYGALDSSGRTELETLATAFVVVAPAEDLDDGEVVATAWLQKLECSEVDVEALTVFIADRQGAVAFHN